MLQVEEAATLMLSVHEKKDACTGTQGRRKPKQIPTPQAGHFKGKRHHSLSPFLTLPCNHSSRHAWLQRALRPWAEIFSASGEGTVAETQSHCLLGFGATVAHVSLSSSGHAIHPWSVLGHTLTITKPIFQWRFSHTHSGGITPTVCMICRTS